MFNMKKAFILFVFIFYIFANITYSFAQNTETYQNVSSFDGKPTTTVFTGDSTASVTDVFNNILTWVYIAIILFILVRVIMGAVIKGTTDNIYGQNNGKKMLETAGIALVIFIFAYAGLAFINPQLAGWSLDTNFLLKNIPRETYNPGNTDGLACNPNAKYNSTNIMDMLLQDEGERNSIYKDTAGKDTIGVGFNIERDKPEIVKKQLIDAGVSESDSIKLVDKRDINVKIKPEVIKKLLDADFESHKKIAINYAGGQTKFNALPQNIQNVLIDMTFNMGSMDKFVKLKAGLDAKNWDTVAQEIVDSKYCGDVPNRCSRLANLASPNYCQKLLDQNKSVASRNKSATCNEILSIKESDLETIQGNFKLTKERAKQFKLMEDRANLSGIKLKVLSAYRSDSRQEEVCKESCGKPFCDNTNNTDNKLCAKSCRLGGYGSNHSRGDAVDIDNGCKNGGSVSQCINNPVYKWMRDIGSGYGFIQNETIKETDAIHYSSTGG